MAPLFARLILPERIAFVCAGAICVHAGPDQPSQKLVSLLFLYCSCHPLMDQDRLKGVAANQGIGGGNLHPYAVPTFARSVWTTRTGLGHDLAGCSTGYPWGKDR